VSAICAAGPTSRASRDARIEGVKRQLELATARERLKHAGQLPACADPQVDALIRSDELRQSQVDYVTRISAFPAVRERLAKIRASMAEQVDRSQAPDGEREQARRLIAGSTVLFSLADLPASIATDELTLNDFVPAYERYCAEDGWRESSFTYRAVDPDTKQLRLYVVVCPGWVAAAPAAPEAAALNLSYVYAHELGHVIDVGFGHDRKLLSGYLDCVGRRFGSPRPGGLSAADAKELSADYWAALQTARELGQATASSRPERLARLRAEWAGLCGRSLQPDHPDGAYRLRAALSSNAAILRALGCKPKAEDACSGDVDGI
jgi:hypothetical protein